MNDQPIFVLLKRLTQKLDLNFISYVGYPPDQEVPYPEGFLEGYHKCLQDFLNETQRLGFNPTVQYNEKTTAQSTNGSCD